MTRRFAVSGLRDVKVYERFVEKVCELVEGSWDEMVNGVEMWEVIRDSMLMLQRSCLGGRQRNNQTGSRRKVPC